MTTDTHDQLQLIEFAGTLTVFNPENSEEWLCMAFSENADFSFQEAH